MSTPVIPTPPRKVNRIGLEPATYRGAPLGSLGDLGILSFHETKNVWCGEGGAILVNDEKLVPRAQVLLDKGTDRGRFLRGEVAAYTWRDMGSSFGASDLAAAFLWAQLDAMNEITASNRRIWDTYHHAFAGLEQEGRVRRPAVAADCTHNAHIYHLLVTGPPGRDGFIDALGARGVQALFHYMPLHLSQAGQRFGRAHGDLEATVEVSAQIARLPRWVGMPDHDVQRVITAVHEALAAPV